MASCLGSFFFIWERVITEAFTVSHSQLWVWNHWYHHNRCFLAHNSQQLHWSWISTWFLKVSLTKINHMVSSGIMDQGVHGSVDINVVSAVRKATGTKDTNMAFGGSIDHWYQHSLRWQQRPYTSTWLPVTTGVTDTYLHGPWQQDGPGIWTWPQDRECGHSKDHRSPHSLRLDHGHQHGLK